MYKVTTFQYMYLQTNGGIRGSRIMANYKGNGGRNWIQAFIIKIVNKDWRHSWQQAFLEHFTLGGFGSPEKDQGFVFCGGRGCSVSSLLGVGLVSIFSFLGYLCLCTGFSLDLDFFLPWCGRSVFYLLLDSLLVL